MSDRCYRRALPLARGALALGGWRLLCRALVGLPLLVAAFEVSDALARRPYFADAPRPLPVVQLLQALGELGSLLPLLAGLALLWLLVEQVLTGGALSWLDPLRLSRPAAHRAAGHTSVARTLARDGAAQLFVMLRLVLLGALLYGAAQYGLAEAREAIQNAAEPAGASGFLLMITVPLLLLGAFALLAVVLSSLALHARAISVADGRRRVRRTVIVALRLWRRHPLRWLVPGLARVLLLAAGALLLFGWRQSAPRGLALLAFVGGWIAYVVLETYVWLWLLWAARLLYAGRRAAPLRDTPDAPWGVWRWLARYAFFWRRRTTSESNATP